MENSTNELWKSIGSYEENEDDWLQEDSEIEFAIKESLALAQLQQKERGQVSDPNASFQKFEFELNPEEDDDDEFVDLSYLKPTNDPKQEEDEEESLDGGWQEVEKGSPRNLPKVSKFDGFLIKPSFDLHNSNSEPNTTVTTSTSASKTLVNNTSISSTVKQIPTPKEEEYEEKEEYEDPEEQEYDGEDYDSDEDPDIALVKQYKAQSIKQKEVKQRAEKLREERSKRLDKIKSEERKKKAKEEADAENSKKKKKKGKKSKGKEEEVTTKPSPSPQKPVVQAQPTVQVAASPSTLDKPVTANATAPTLPFKVSITHRKSVTASNEVKKDLLVIPSIKFSSFLLYVYKTFGLDAPVTFSLLYADSRGQSRIEQMDQLRAGNAIFLIEDITDAPKVQEASDNARKQETNNGKQEESTNKEKELRAPIVCVLGHVDTGKTSLLDKVRSTHVQEGEAGGITQQIGATYFPVDTIKRQTAEINTMYNFEFKIPGMLIIDTPGHESFSNLRTRGSSLCDVAILVIDIMHGLEAQTIESINLLKKRRIPFVIALNKVDKLYNWKSTPEIPFGVSFDNQEEEVKTEFHKRTQEIISEIAVQGLNAVLYWKNKDFKKYVSIVPTSARTGEGLQDLELLLVLLTQNCFRRRLYKLPADQLRCVVLEVKVIEGLGSTIDVLLVNGKLQEGDTIVVAGMNGPITTAIKSIVTPQPLEELRVKGDVDGRIREAEAVQGLKLFAKNLEKAVAGSPLWVVNYMGNRKESEPEIKKRVSEDLNSLINHWGRSPTGVYVQASSLGSLEALIDFLKSNDVPIAGANIGPVNRRDVLKAAAARFHHRGYCVILAFDVKVKKSAAETANVEGVTIFRADIIYHLFDSFKSHIKRYAQLGAKVIYPCIMTILPEYIIKTSNPIVVGVYLEGTIQIDTPLCIPYRKFMMVGRVTAIRVLDSPDPTTAATNTIAIIKIEPTEASKPGEDTARQVILGRDFDITDRIYSKITSVEQLPDIFRRSVDPFVQDYKRVFGLKTVRDNYF